MLVLEIEVSSHRQNEVSDWLMAHDCRYAMAWGVDCHVWDDAIDWAYLAKKNYAPVHDWEHDGIMTTWHEEEQLEEVFDFCKRHATHATGKEPILHTLILHIADRPDEDRLLALYAGA
nr:hypothetical protein [Silvimonas amylolytica]